MNFNTKRMYRMCLHKRKYKDENTANKFAKECTEKYGKEHRVYWCALCGCYHLTTKEKWSKNENAR